MMFFYGGLIFIKEIIKDYDFDNYTVFIGLGSNLDNLMPRLYLLLTK